MLHFANLSLLETFLVFEIRKNLYYLRKILGVNNIFFKSRFLCTYCKKSIMKKSIKCKKAAKNNKHTFMQTIRLIWKYE